MIFHNVTHSSKNLSTMVSSPCCFHVKNLILLLWNRKVVKSTVFLWSDPTSLSSIFSPLSCPHVSGLYSFHHGSVLRWPCLLRACLVPETSIFILLFKKEIFKGGIVAFQNSYKTYENAIFLTHLKPYYINSVYWFFPSLLLNLILSIISPPSKQKKE